MDSSHGISVDRRKRRRRRLRPPPVSAKLTLDERGKGNVGLVSQDLFARLFGQLTEDNHHDEIHHVAITPWQPPSTGLEEECSWTVVAVRLGQTQTSSSLLRFPSSCLALQRFAAALQASKIDSKSTDGIQVLVLDVQPLPLETVFVKVDGEALKKHEEVQKKFGGGFRPPQQNGHIGKGKLKDPVLGNRPFVGENKTNGGRDIEGRLKAAVRESLASSMVVHVNDQLSLPLPAHPITHVPFPPVEVVLCEPIDQGLMIGSTTIVIDMTSKGKSRSHLSKNHERDEPFRRMISEEDEDTSAEHFYSAMENDEVSEVEDRSTESNGEYSTTIESSDEDEDSLSDDSADNMISLNAPILPMPVPGIMFAETTATPRPFGMRPSGVQTPGSIHSNFTATTARQNGMAGRPFQLKPLLKKVPDFLLHPKPHADEDDESRIFVDVKTLVRLGCFSGEWVKILTAPKSDDGNDQFWPLGAFGDDENVEEFRAVKIYGLVDAGGSDVIQYPKATSARRQSQSSVIPTSRPTPSAFVSPILFSNLGQPKKVMLAPLSTSQQNDKKFSRSKLSSSAIPPVANEITLVRIPTPLTTERAVQAGLVSNLKRYFESRRRVLREGDLVAISVDAEASRMFSDASISSELDTELEELLSSSPSDPYAETGPLSVAWFKVSQISISISDDSHHGLDLEIWGGVSSIEPMMTRMVQAGSKQEKILSTLEVPWDYYLGVRSQPKTITYRASSSLPAFESLPQRPTVPMRRRIRELLAASTSDRAVHLGLRPLVLLLHSTQRSIGKSSLASAACADLGLHLFSLDSYEILTDGPGGGDVKTEASLRARIERALTCGAMFTVPLIKHVEALTADRMASTIKDILGDVRALVMTTTEIEKVPANIRSLATHELEFSAPDERERKDILSSIIDTRALRLAYDVDIAKVAVKTAALVAGDLIEVLERAVCERESRLDSMASLHDEALRRDVLVSGGTAALCITKTDFDIAVEAARKNFADAIGAPKIPNVSWDDVGGLANVKDAVMETIQLPLERPELFAKGLKKRSGILFYGPPGTGKTLLAKAIATEFSLNFFSVKGPELLNMYIGESEANVRRVFQRARDARPCVVFFDELDSVAPKRGNQGDSGGVMDRIVIQLLAELDGMSDGSGGGVFVIGATNRPDLLDQALLRPGRFDKMLYLGVSDTHEKQLTILEALTRKFVLHPEASLHRVAERLPFTYTGADLYALSSDAMLKAIMRQASAVDAKIKARPGEPITTTYFFDHLATEEDLAVMVTEEDFLSAQRELIGSVR